MSVKTLANYIEVTDTPMILWENNRLSSHNRSPLWSGVAACRIACITTETIDGRSGMPTCRDTPETLQFLNQIQSRADATFTWH
jgi:hypothetical protein